MRLEIIAGRKEHFWGENPPIRKIEASADVYRKKDASGAACCLTPCVPFQGGQLYVLRANYDIHFSIVTINLKQFVSINFSKM